MIRLSTVVMLFVTLAVPASQVFGQSAGFELGPQFLIPGGISGPIAIDAATHRIYVPQDTHVSVLDEKTGTLVGEIADTPGVSRVAVDELSSRAFIISDNASTLTLVPTDVPGFTDRQTARLRHPANLLFVDPSSQRGIAVSEFEVTAIERWHWKVLEKPLGSDFGIPTVVAPGINGRAYIAFQGGVIGVLNTETLQIAEEDKHSLGKGCKNPTTLLLDGSGEHLLVGCGDGRLKTFNLTTWKELGSLKVCSQPNGAAFYKGEDFIVSSCADRLTFVQEHDSQPLLTVLQELKMEQRINSMGLDPNAEKNDPTIILAVIQHSLGDVPSGGASPSLAIRKVSRTAVSGNSTNN